MRRMKALCVVLLLMASVMAAMGDENPSVERLQSQNGWINWERQVVKAVGRGVLPGDVDNPTQAGLMARAAAIADAYRNLSMMVNGVRVTGETYVKNYITQSDEVRVRVQGLIQGAEIVSEKQLADRSFEVIVQLPLSGKSSVISEIAPTLLKGSGEFESEQDGVCTGLVIDARGLGIKPAMSPRVYDQDGNEVYGTLKVSPDYAIDAGIAVYPQSMESALKSPRAAKNPIVIRAVSRGKKLASDLVISSQDAEWVKEADRESGFLAKCRVSIVIADGVVL